MSKVHRPQAIEVDQSKQPFRIVIRKRYQLGNAYQSLMARVHLPEQHPAKARRWAFLPEEPSPSGPPTDGCQRVIDMEYANQPGILHRMDLNFASPTFSKDLDVEADDAPKQEADSLDVDSSEAGSPPASDVSEDDLPTVKREPSLKHKANTYGIDDQSFSDLDDSSLDAGSEYAISEDDSRPRNNRPPTLRRSARLTPQRSVRSTSRTSTNPGPPMVTRRQAAWLHQIIPAGLNEDNLALSDGDVPPESTRATPSVNEDNGEDNVSPAEEEVTSSDEETGVSYDKEEDTSSEDDGRSSSSDGRSAPKRGRLGYISSRAATSFRIQGTPVDSNDKGLGPDLFAHDEDVTDGRAERKQKGKRNDGR